MISRVRSRASVGLSSVVLCVTVLACDEGDLVVLPEPVQSIALLPGTEATYAWTFAEVDSAGKERITASDSVLSRVVATHEVLAPDSDLARVRAYSLGRYNGDANVWYSQTSERFVEVAYSGAGRTPVIMPKGATAPAVTAADQGGVGAIFDLPVMVRRLLATKKHVADSVIRREDPRIVYEYPLVLGKNWVSFRSPFLQTREVVGIELVQVAAGSFRCVKIRTRAPEFVPDLEWYDYVSQDGLVLRTLSYGIGRTAQDPTVVDTLQVRERAELLYFHPGQ